MYHESIVSELLDWIEDNLDQSLTLDTIAAKSGYSKWHLQRLFKTFTGQTLGTYTRQRRLTMAATELRLTQNSVLRIADKYQFDSQQTFTRTFKKQFKITPAVYRRLESWPEQGMISKVEIANEAILDLESKGNFSLKSLNSGSSSSSSSTAFASLNGRRPIPPQGSQSLAP